MSQAATIRPATLADIAAITAIYAPAVLTGKATFEIEPPDAAEMTRRYDAISRDGFPYLVADIGGRVGGYAYLNHYRTRPAYRWTVEDSVYVDSTLQGLGMGRALLAELIREGEARGYRQIVAVIGDSANMPSIGLHRALGFAFCGVLHAVGFKHGRWLDSVMMQKALGAGETAPPH